MLDNKHNGTFSCLIEGHALYSDGIIWTAVRYGAWKGSNSFWRIPVNTVQYLLRYICGEIEVKNTTLTENWLKLRTAVCKLIIDPYGSRRVRIREGKRWKKAPKMADTRATESQLHKGRNGERIIRLTDTYIHLDSRLWIVIFSYLKVEILHIVFEMTVAQNQYSLCPKFKLTKWNMAEKWSLHRRYLPDLFWLFSSGASGWATYCNDIVLYCISRFERGRHFLCIWKVFEDLSCLSVKCLPLLPQASRQSITVKGLKGINA